MVMISKSKQYVTGYNKLYYKKNKEKLTIKNELARQKLKESLPLPSCYCHDCGKQLSTIYIFRKHMKSKAHLNQPFYIDRLFKRGAR